MTTRCGPFTQVYLFELLNPFALLCGLLSICMLAMHGAAFLLVKTSGIIQERAARYVHLFGLLTILLFAFAGIWIVIFYSWLHCD